MQSEVKRMSKEEIQSYQKKVEQGKKAIKEIYIAISNYDKAYEKLKKIRGVGECEILKKKISLKQKDLHELIKKIKRENSTYNIKIDNLEQTEEEM